VGRARRSTLLYRLNLFTHQYNESRVSECDLNMLLQLTALLKREMWKFVVAIRDSLQNNALQEDIFI
jgi:hypothetical protein